ncbi:MAG: hypothetical protein HQL15_10310, partial [Candidatus Omnitrophica bacterium]|nr:hypothetical protein [Candidatus Omnitrophota bacterium]
EVPIFGPTRVSLLGVISAAIAGVVLYQSAAPTLTYISDHWSFISQHLFFSFEHMLKGKGVNVTAMSAALAWLGSSAVMMKPFRDWVDNVLNRVIKDKESPVSREDNFVEENPLASKTLEAPVQIVSPVDLENERKIHEEERRLQLANTEARKTFLNSTPQREVKTVSELRRAWDKLLADYYHGPITVKSFSEFDPVVAQKIINELVKRGNIVDEEKGYLGQLVDKHITKTKTYTVHPLKDLNEDFKVALKVYKLGNKQFERIQEILDKHQHLDMGKMNPEAREGVAKENDSWVRYEDHKIIQEYTDEIDSLKKEIVDLRTKITSFRQENLDLSPDVLNQAIAPANLELETMENELKGYLENSYEKVRVYAKKVLGQVASLKQNATISKQYEEDAKALKVFNMLKSGDASVDEQIDQVRTLEDLALKLKAKNVDGKSNLALRLLREIVTSNNLNLKALSPKVISEATTALKNIDDIIRSDKENGGIDLTGSNFDLQIRRDGKGVPLPVMQQDMAQLSRIEGFVPVIIDIKPVTSLPLLSELEQNMRIAEATPSKMSS